MADSLLKQLENGTAPVAMKMAIAEGLLPLEGAELVQALSYLSRDASEKIRNALLENLPEMPRGFLLATASQPDTPKDLLFTLAKVFERDSEILQSIILNRSVDDRTLVLVAEHGPSSVLEILAQNRNRMLENPLILKKLLENEQISRVTRFSLEEFQERFDVDIDAENIIAEEISSLDAAEDLSIASEVVEDVEMVATEDLETRSLDDDDDDELTITDELMLNIDKSDYDLSEKDETDSEGSVLVDEYDTSEIEMEIESDFIDETFLAEEEASDDDDDGWSIENLVKMVSGFDVGDGTDKPDGFDDILNIKLDDDDSTSDSKDWMGLDSIEFARKHGLKLDDEDEGADDEKEEVITDTRIRLMKMGAADKLTLAKMGTKQERAILVTDPNKKVAVAVVEGPKMSEFEIQLIASNRQVYEEVLRAIATHRAWGKSPAVKRELVLNPKTPLDLSIRMLNSLNDFTLKDVTKSKEIPSALAVQAKRVLAFREKRRS